MLLCLNYKMVIDNKRGQGMSWQMVLLILAMILLVGFAFFWSSGLREGKASIGVFSVSKNSLAITACNAYCAYLKGDRAAGAFVLSEGAARESYCNEPRIFVSDKDKEEKSTCKERQGTGTMGILDCESFC